MSIDARIADNQPDSFAFTRENEAEINRIVAKYPKGRQASAVMPLLDLAQRQHDNSTLHNSHIQRKKMIINKSTPKQ